MSISIPNCKSIAHFLSPKWGVFYLQKHTNYDVGFQSRFLLFLGVVRKNKWHHWIPEEKLVQMPALPPVPIRRYRLHASIHGRHPLSPEAKLVMHCGSCCDALWVTADAAAGARPGAAATTMDFRPREAPFFLAITSSDLARSLSNFRTLHFSPSADFCQYVLLTQNR